MDVESRCKELLYKSISIFPQELNELDWKEKLSDNNLKLSKHLAAFANFPDGGFLVYGINDEGKPIGIGAQDVKSITEKLANISRDNLEPGVILEWIKFEYSGVPLFAVYIPESVQKPVHLKNKGFEESYIRAGGQTRQMSQNEIRASMISSRTLRYEELPAVIPEDKKSRWPELFDFSEFVKRTRFTNTENKDALYEHLLQHGLLAKTHGKYIPTNLAVLICAKDFTLFPGYEKLGVRLTEYNGQDKISSRRDIPFNMGYSLSLDDIEEKIVAIIPHSEIIERATRINEPVIPRIAIREVLVNAVMHRDFFKNESFITIDVFTNRIEFTNPGGLLPGLSPDRLVDHPSRTRNEVLAKTLRQLRFAEEGGTGYDKIVTALDLYGLPAFKNRATENYYSVILYNPQAYKDMGKEERIEAVYWHSCLNYVVGKRTNNQSIRERFRLADHTTKVSRLIKECIEKKRIKCANTADRKKDWYYIPYWA